MVAAVAVFLWPLIAVGFVAFDLCGFYFYFYFYGFDSWMGFG